MIEIAEVFRRFAAGYLSAHGTSMLPSHRRAIEDILDCRTAALGGQVWHCEACNTEAISYPGCASYTPLSAKPFRPTLSEWGTVREPVPQRHEHLALPLAL